jgi:hypothetical protein
MGRVFDCDFSWQFNTFNLLWEWSVIGSVIWTGFASQVFGEWLELPRAIQIVNSIISILFLSLISWSWHFGHQACFCHAVSWLRVVGGVRCHIAGAVASHASLLSPHATGRQVRHSVSDLWHFVTMDAESAGQLPTSFQRVLVSCRTYYGHHFTIS